jgi:hypothetical protein
VPVHCNDGFDVSSAEEPAFWRDTAKTARGNEFAVVADKAKLNPHRDRTLTIPSTCLGTRSNRSRSFNPEAMQFLRLGKAPFSVFVDDGLKQSPQHSHFDPQVT